MSEKFKNLMRYAFKEYYDSYDPKYDKILSKITNSLIDIAHENGWEQEVSKILHEFTK